MPEGKGDPSALKRNPQMPARVDQTPLTPLIWGVIVLLSLFWGGSFPANKVALQEVPVLTLVALRALGAAVVLWAWVFWRGIPVPRAPRRILDFFLLGIASNAVPFLLVGWGQQFVPAGLAGIITSSVAIVTVILGALVFRDERLAANKLAGVMVGVVGVAFTLDIANLRHFSVTSVGQLAIFAGGSSYAVATIYARVVLRGIRPEVAAASMFTSAALVLSCLAIWQDGMPDFAFRPTTWVALGFLATLSSALAYILLYEFLDRAGAGNMNLSTLLNGPVAVVLGAALFGEVLSANVYLGLALIATGLVLVDGRILGLIARRG